ncbi:hypothetical protein ACVWYG_003732 [Pedobacter sp. UYEF25]
MTNIENRLKEKLRLVSDRDITLDISEIDIYSISTSDILSIEDQMIESEGDDGD